MMLLVLGLTLHGQNLLKLERMVGDRFRIVLELSESAGGLQIALVGRPGVSFRSICAGSAASTHDWMIAWHETPDACLRVIVLGNRPGSMPQGIHEVITWEARSDVASAALSVCEAVLADDAGRRLPLELRTIERTEGQLERSRLLGSHPNPFNPSTVISFDVTDPSLATLEVFDITGRRIETLFEGWGAGGIQQAVWDAGRLGLASGVYIARLTVNGRSSVTRLNYIR
jgi:hypothetical protein